MIEPLRPFAICVARAGVRQAPHGIGSVAIEHVPGRRQRNTACRSFEQREAKLLLKLTDAAAERRLGDAEKFSRPSEIQRFGDREKILNFGVKRGVNHRESGSLSNNKKVSMEASSVLDRHD